MGDKMDPKYIGGGLAAIGILAAAAAGYVNITTPEAAQCAVDLADSQARLELMTERVGILNDAKEACKTALESCAGEE